MNKRVKPFFAIAVVTLIVICLSFGLSACNFYGLESRNLNMIADQFAYALLGNDAFSWNVFSVNPEDSFGYVSDGEDEWYSYNRATQQDMDDVYGIFSFFNYNLARINQNKLKGNDIATYNTMKHLLDSFMDYYGSEYALKFTLMGGSYISSEGGYVADFTSCVENFSFRTKNDLDILLSITRSTEDAFKSYLDFASDRLTSDMPLYDYTINEMQAYLAEILEQGESYYLYKFLNNKIDGADFLNETQIASYKALYKSAISNEFFTGVKALYDGLDAYKGNVTETEMTYLAAYGEAGKAYYEWSFENKTGLKNIDLINMFTQLSDVYGEHIDRINEILEYVNSLETTNKPVFDEFNEYLNGDKVLMGFEDPMEMLDYLKEASKEIVPDLNNEPNIDFYYMDETVAKRSTTMAYYLHSPIDELDATEQITLNPYYAYNDPRSPLLLTIAHEGYPGHLYACVNAKEKGLSLLVQTHSVSAFSEGWAVYTEIALLEQIAQNAQREALKLYCEYTARDILSGYLMPVITDINLNYFGFNVQDGMELGIENIQDIIETLMEIPTVYVSYGYGAYVMQSLHEQAKLALGDNYNEVEFNGLLLAEGMGPTLIRARELTNNYIYSKA